jgi:tRNA(Ile)-lysidine synthase
LPRARNLLRHFIEQHGQPMPSARRLDEALHQLRNAQADARVRVRLGEVELHRFRGQARLVAHAAEGSSDAIEWHGEAQLDLPWLAQPLCFSAATGTGVKREWLEAGAVEVRKRQGGERLRPLAGGPHRSLKNLLQEAAIPPWQRDTLPLLWCGGKLAWAAGVGYDADCLAEPGEAGIILSLGGQ